MKRALLAVLIALGCQTVAAGPAYLAIVIDDLGNRPRQDRRVINLPGPVACAILPHTPGASQLAERAHALGKEVLLHQPMESTGQSALGPGGLTTEMTQAQVQRRLRLNLDSLPHISGMNNHMGSQLTHNLETMSWVMEALSARENLFFLDSRTTAATVAYQTALSQGVPSTQRDIFLDNDRQPELITDKLNEAIALAKRNGSAIAIGHPYAATVAALEQLLPLLATQDVQLVSIETIIRYRLAGGETDFKLADNIIPLPHQPHPEPATHATKTVDLTTHN